MTWSIIATNRATAEIGIAVATKFFAVGARVPHIAARFGGIATQALVNPYYGIDGLKLLRAGKSPQEVVATLIAADAGRESRQLHIMDVEGRIAVHTGRECVECAAISRARVSPLPAICSPARGYWTKPRGLMLRTKTFLFRNG